MVTTIGFVLGITVLVIRLSNRQSRSVLQGKLDSVNASIAAHPLSSVSVKQAHAIIEAREKSDKEGVARELAEQGLPDLPELGKIQVQSTVSWWQLHRQQNKLIKKLRLPD